MDQNKDVKEKRMKDEDLSGVTGGGCEVLDTLTIDSLRFETSPPALAGETSGNGKNRFYAGASRLDGHLTPTAISFVEEN